MGFKQEKFKKLIEHKSGYTWSKDQELDKPENGAVRVLTVTNIQEKLDLSSELYLKEVKDRNKADKSVSKNWTIAVSSNGNRKRIGNAIFIEDDTDYLFASFLTAFKPKEDSDIIPEYFFYWFSSHVIQERITSVSEGTTGLGNLDIRYLRNMDIEYPDNEAEQQAIATILSKVDEAIKATENGIKAAEKLKRSLMQNLLSGKLKPDGNWRKTDEFYKDEKFGNVPIGWQVKKVKEVSNCLDSKRKPIKAEDRKEMAGEYRYYGAAGIIDYVNDYIFDGRYILFGEDGENLISRKLPQAFIVEGKFWVNNHAHILESIENISDLDFLCYQLEFKNYENIVYGSAQPKINKSDLNKIRVLIPDDVNEQLAISKRISNMDLIIDKKIKKIKSLQRLKKSLMQNLLTGKLRVDINKIENILADATV